MTVSSAVLVACSRLVDIAGAEITTIELAQAFSGLGWDVTVAAFEVDALYRRELDSIGVSFVSLDSEAYVFSGRKFDLAWIHHGFAANRILSELELSLEKVVFSSLSHFDPMECPPATFFKVSRYVVNSEENLDFFLQRYPALKSRVMVMNNSVAARYWTGCSSKIKYDLRRIALVSNHPPQEVIDLIPLLRARGIHVDYFGVGGEYVRVTPDLVRGYDAIISIGKTVQYGIAACVPVFCYDHFGGYGWITVSNFNLARRNNFSGRGGSRVNCADALLQDLVGNYWAAVDCVAELKRIGVEYFVTEDNINAVLSDLSLFERTLSSTDSSILIRQSLVFMRLRREIGYRDSRVLDLEHALRRERENAEAQIEYRDELVLQLNGQICAEKENAKAQILYRDELISQLWDKIAAEKDNAQAQIQYRDELVSQLNGQICAEKENAKAQILYRDELISQLWDKIAAEKDNAQAQIQYRDELVSQLNGQICAEKENAKAQILYRDELISQLWDKIAAEKDNAQAQIQYRDELVLQLNGQINAARENAAAEILYRDELIAQLRDKIAAEKDHL
jgi:hypothetical protein